MNWRDVALHPGTLREPSEGARLVVWVPGERTAGGRVWERVSTVAGAQVGRHEALGKPQARVYAEHLQKFLPAPTAPGHLRMAVSAAQSFGRFVASGLKTVSAQTLRERLRRCADCGQYTGLRCRACGCFVSLKARLPHEDCSLGKWATDKPTPEGS
jgi:hypothetical protein